MMVNDLEMILYKGEGYTVEFKEAADKSIVDEACAFANASGGTIYVGINDKNEIVGTDTSNAARSRLQDTLNKIEPRIAVNINIHDTVIVIEIPEGKNKPYSSPNGFYLRSGPNSQKLDRNGIIDFLQTEGKVIYDYIVDDKYPINDNFNETEYQKFLSKAKVSDILPREIMLKNLDCADIAANGTLSYTNAGLLFFRDNSDNVRFDFSHVVCVLYKGIDKVYIIDAKHLNGGIMDNIDNAIVFLKRNLRLSYEITTLQRKNILELPEDALREAITNAVCHRDNFEKGARVMIEIFDDRVEITNPGAAPKGITKENFGTISIARNPVIASLLHRANYIERMGTGINRMTGTMEAAGLEKPIFQTEGHFFKVIFYRSPSTAIDSDRTAIDSDRTAIDSDRTAIDSDRTAIDSDRTAIDSDRTAIDSDRTAAVINYLQQYGKGKNSDFTELLGLRHQRVREILQILVHEGLIEKHGDKRHTFYTLK
ncbi:MAG: putative DNA binding domain-containing protein [Lachnospiraceae bacterium]|nr:putative DNA binding domain-containing protein [Lachnospiraceae bacterium]